MMHADVLAKIQELAPDFTIGEEDVDSLDRSGKPCTVRLVIARCTIGGLPYERSEPVGPGAETRVLDICLHSLTARSAGTVPAPFDTWDLGARA